jgi:hypothetical protein
MFLRGTFGSLQRQNRSTWGNNATPVKPEQVAAARKEVHPGPMTSAELQQIPVQ